VVDTIGADREKEDGMNKRSAMLLAAGLVMTLIVGGVAMMVGLTGPTPSQAAPRAGHRQKAPKPIIKTVKHTVTVHKKGEATSAATTGSSGYGSAGSVSGSSDDSDDQGSTYDDQGDDNANQGDDDQMGDDDDSGDDQMGDDDSSDDQTGDDHGDDRLIAR
jgi:hypothetical protein